MQVGFSSQVYKCLDRTLIEFEAATLSSYHLMLVELCQETSLNKFQF